MKTLFIIFSFLVVLSTKAKSQTLPDTIRYRVEQKFYQNLLKIDGVKARKVAIIQGSYKDKLTEFFGKLDLEAKSRAKAIAGLDSIRNSQLSQLLTSEEIAILNKMNSH